MLDHLEQRQFDGWTAFTKQLNWKLEDHAGPAIIGHLRKYLSEGKLGLVVVDDRGNTLAIAPEQSAAVVVDDTPAEIEDLRRKRESDESRPNPVLRSRPTVLGNPQVPSPEKTDPE